MVIEFRVLAISKETKNYSTDLLKGLFMIESPILDTVDNFAPQNAINIISSSGWKPTVKEVINTDTHILLPLIGNTF